MSLQQHFMITVMTYVESMVISFYVMLYCMNLISVKSIEINNVIIKRFDYISYLVFDTYFRARLI